MATIDFDPADYLDEVSTRVLVEELMSRKGRSRDPCVPGKVGIVETGAAMEFCEEILTLLEHGDTREAKYLLRKEMLKGTETPIEKRYAQWREARSSH